MKWLLAFVLALGFAPLASAHEFQDFPWLVKVRSIYSDGKKHTAFTGHGFLVDAGERRFVVTVSHLSQGGIFDGFPSLTLERFDTKAGAFRVVPWIRRVAHNRRDVEVIEIARDASVEALAEWQNPETLPAVARTTYPLGRLRVKPRWEKLFRSDTWPGGFTVWGLDAFVPKVTLFAQSPESPLASEAPAAVAEKVRQAKSFFVRQRLLVGFDLAEGEIVSSLPIRPGMSGLPLLRRYTDAVVIAGAATSGSRAFGASWFATDQAILYTLSKLIALPALNAGESPEVLTGPVYWRCRDGLLYRSGESGPLRSATATYRIAFQEAVFTRSAAGDATSADGGNGTSADGGNGTSADGGNGTSADGGGPATSFAPAPPLDPGVLYTDGAAEPSAVVAFAVRSAGHSYLLPGDFTSVGWILEESYGKRLDLNSVEALGANSSLAERMWREWTVLHPAGANGESRVSLNHDRLVPLEVESSGSAEARLKFRDGGLDVRLDFGAERISFRLGRRGGLADQPFKPEIAVKARSGRMYRIDLTGFLVTTPAVFNFSWESTPAISTALKDIIPNPHVRFRVKSSEEELLLWK